MLCKNQERYYGLDWLKLTGAVVVCFLAAMRMVERYILLDGTAQDVPDVETMQKRFHTIYRYFVQFGGPAFFYVGGQTLFWKLTKENSRLDLQLLMQMGVPFAVGIFWIWDMHLGLLGRSGLTALLSVDYFVWPWLAQVVCAFICAPWLGYFLQATGNPRTPTYLGAATVATLAAGVLITQYYGVPQWFLLFSFLGPVLYFLVFGCYTSARKAGRTTLQKYLLIASWWVAPLVSLIWLEFHEGAVNEAGCPSSADWKAPLCYPRQGTYLLLLLIFFMHGVVVTPTMREWENLKGDLMIRNNRPWMVFLMIILLGYGVPDWDYNPGHTWVLPHYREATPMRLGMYATWAWVYCLDIFGRYFLNDEPPFPQVFLMAKDATRTILLYGWLLAQAVQLLIFNHQEPAVITNLFGSFVFCLVGCGLIAVVLRRLEVYKVYRLVGMTPRCETLCKSL